MTYIIIKLKTGFTNTCNIDQIEQVIVKYLVCYKNNITVKIRISHNNETIRVYHSPHEVIVRPKAKKVEIYDINGEQIETYELIEKKLSWLEDSEVDAAEIMLDLKVNR